jgi:hypothetical protein
MPPPVIRFILGLMIALSLVCLWQIHSYPDGENTLDLVAKGFLAVIVIGAVVMLGGRFR